jgi:hypothetical protein
MSLKSSDGNTFEDTFGGVVEELDINEVRVKRCQGFISGGSVERKGQIRRHPQQIIGRRNRRGSLIAPPKRTVRKIQCTAETSADQ